MAQSKPSCVLVTRFSALGDVAMVMPVLYDVARANPEVRFVMVSRPWVTHLSQLPPENLTVVPIDLKKDYSKPWAMVRLARELHRDYGITALADLHSVLRSWILGAALRLQGVTVRRIDKGRREKQALINGKTRHPVQHTTQRYRQVFARLGLDTDSRQAFQSFYHDALPECLYGEKPTGMRWVAIAPFAAHPGKEYPTDKMLQVVTLLAAQENTRIFLLGGGEREKAILARWSKALDKVTAVTDAPHNLSDELALMARCDVMLSMDSANMHLASLVATPVVSVWGSTHPDCGFMGYGQSERLAVQLPLDCRPCSVYGERPCRFRDYHCLTDIAPEQIVEKVNQTLQ